MRKLCLHFLPHLQLDLILTFNFSKIVQQHVYGMMKIGLLDGFVELVVHFQWLKNFEDRLRFDEITAISLMATFILKHSAYILYS